MPNLISSHVRANVVGYVALFLALGGVSYAAGLRANSVKSKHIKNGQVKSADLRPPEAWRQVAAGSTTADRCADPNLTSTFCSDRGADHPDPWRNYGGAHPTAAFYKDQLGIVHLKGVVKTQTFFGGADPIRRRIFRLPAGYRPTTVRVFPTVGSVRAEAVVAGRVDVLPNGEVQLVKDCDSQAGSCSAEGGDITLDGITFRPND